MGSMWTIPQIVLFVFPMVTSILVTLIELYEYTLSKHKMGCYKPADQNENLLDVE